MSYNTESFSLLVLYLYCSSSKGDVSIRDCTASNKYTPADNEFVIKWEEAVTAYCEA
jgi:hypothetical protein